MYKTEQADSERIKNIRKAEQASKEAERERYRLKNERNKKAKEGECRATIYFKNNAVTSYFN